MDQKDFYSTGEVAAVCGVTIQTVWRWVNSGKLKAVRFAGGHNRIGYEDLKTFLAEGSQEIGPSEGVGSKKVLIVDDSAEVVDSLRRLLRKQGFGIAVAQNGFQAGRLVESFQPDLLILDLSLPYLDGFEVIRQIRSTEVSRKTAILVLSGLARGELEKAVTLGADDYLSKPADKATLMDKIQALLKRKTNQV